MIEDFTVQLWDRYEKGEIKRWPGEDTRLKLARRAMEAELKVRYDTLGASCKRMEKREQALTWAMRGRISILSAEKTLAEVT